MQPEQPQLPWFMDPPDPDPEPNPFEEILKEKVVDLRARIAEQEGKRGRHTIDATGMHPSSQRFAALLAELWEMHKKKSAGYGTDADPLANVRNGARALGISPWLGAQLRAADKTQRIYAYVGKGAKAVDLKDEKKRDAFLDRMGYDALTVVLIDEEAGDAEAA